MNEGNQESAMPTVTQRRNNNLHRDMDESMRLLDESHDQHHRAIEARHIGATNQRGMAGGQGGATTTVLNDLMMEGQPAPAAVR